MFMAFIPPLYIAATLFFQNANQLTGYWHLNYLSSAASDILV